MCIHRSCSFLLGKTEECGSDTTRETPRGEGGVGGKKVGWVGRRWGGWGEGGVGSETVV